MTVRGDILDAIATRLRKITTGNGYAINVSNVYLDEIPMGIQLDPGDMPAILVIDNEDEILVEHQCVKGEWLIELQLIESDEKPDTHMSTFVNACNRVLFADDPVAQNKNAWRSLQPNIYDFRPRLIKSDVHMIDANRIYCLFYVVKYSTSLTEL